MQVINNGLIRESTDILAADRLIKLKATNDVWSVISECINIWSSKHPTKWQSYVINLSDVKQTRKNKFALSHDKVTGGDLRYTVDMPFPLYKMIRSLYPEQELPMDKRFFETFAKKFPLFKVAEKI